MFFLASKLRIYRLEAQIAADEVERALGLLPPGEHEVVHLVALAMSRVVAGRDGRARRRVRRRSRRRAVASRTRAHARYRLAVIWLEEYDARGLDRVGPRAPARGSGFLLYLPQALLTLAELDFRTGDWMSSVAAGVEASSFSRRPTAERSRFRAGILSDGSRAGE